MASIVVYKRKDGRFEGRIYQRRSIDGKHRYASYYGKTDSEVRKKIKMSMNYEPMVLNSCTLTVTELYEEWMSAVSRRVKESTAANYSMKAYKHIIPYFGRMLCSKITRTDVFNFMELKQAEDLSVRYISDIIVLLRSLFKYAAREYNLKNVFDGIRMPKKKKAEVQLLNDFELERLKSHIIRNPSSTTAGIALSLYTGVRIGELCALTWSDIDIDKRVLTVRKTIQRIQADEGVKKTKVIITEPKSASSFREIPIPDCIIPLLNECRKSNETFLLSGKTSPIEPRTMQYRFTKLLKNVNLPSVHFHSLRHLFATKSISKGFDIKTLSEILGHSSVELTLNRYVHSSFERKQKCMCLLNW